MTALRNKKNYWNEVIIPLVLNENISDRNQTFYSAT